MTLLNIKLMKNLNPKLRTMLFSFILLILCSNSCFESDPPRGCDWEEEFESYYDSYMVFVNNPTSSTCQSLKNQALKLIDKYENCDDFGIYLNDLRSSWNTIDCSGL